MRQQLAILIVFISFAGLAQREATWKKNTLFLAPEFLVGKTMEANEGFPKTSLQKQLVIGLGRNHENNPQQWARELNGPRTGLSLGFTDFGQRDSLGYALTALTFIEYQAFGSERWNLLTGIGASYFTQKYDPENNPLNRAVTTNVTWAFRMYLHYTLLQAEKVDWRVGIGYSHHSNGHTRLLNQGYNSFLLSFSALIHNKARSAQKDIQSPIPYHHSTYSYYSLRGGLGQQAFALAFNNRENVYTLALEYGKVYNNTYKVGVGLFYRFYRHYYEYIRNNESLVQPGSDFDYFRGNPWYYASNFGMSLHGEVFLNHIGIDLQLGYNFLKPAYKLDWRINEGWDNTPREIPKYWLLGELDGTYKIKHRISSRLGLKYYLIGMEQAPENNFYLGIHLNANLGQADFTELSLGFVHRFKVIEKD